LYFKESNENVKIPKILDFWKKYTGNYTVQKEKHRCFLVQKSAHNAGAFIFKTPHCVKKKHRTIFYTAQCNVYYSDFVVVRCGAVHCVNAFYTALHTLHRNCFVHEPRTSTKISDCTIKNKPWTSIHPSGYSHIRLFAIYFLHFLKIFVVFNWYRI
jgi:hypothetical protein